MLEEVLDVTARIREEPVSEVRHDDLRLFDAAEERFRARPRLAGTITATAEHDPIRLEFRVRLRQSEYRAAASDLDVVGVRAKREDTKPSVAAHRPMAM